jgi:hypothetical protein
MIKRLPIYFLAFVLLLTTSCATIFTGSKRNVLFETDPSGAKVFINGFEKGITPVQIKVEADDNVEFRLDNYKERVVIMDSKFNLVSILNGFSLIGWGVDALTGSLERVDVKYLKVKLEKDEATALNEYLKNGDITKVSVDEDKKVIETIIVLKD